MKRTAIASALVVCALSATAQAETRLASYGFEATLRAGDDTVHYHLTLDYTARGENKRDGFKFVGRDSVSALRAYGPDGAKLASSDAYEASSGETKLTFGVPGPDARGHQIVHLEFDQLAPRASTYGWGAEVTRIGWAHVFKVPVDQMTAALVLPRGDEAPGFSCKPDPRGTSCTRTSASAAAVALATERSETGLVAAMGVVLTGVIAALIALARSRYARLVALKGVVPAATTEAYPAYATGYRAPAPLPVQQELAPVLPQTDRNALWTRALLAVGGVVVATVAVALVASGSSPIPMPMLVLLVGLGAALISAIYLSIDEGKHWLPAAPAAGVVGLLATGSVFGLGLFLPVLFVGLLAQANFKAGGGGGYSSCSSGSSCGGGGGGGGCGGGGGGGGCGG